MHTNSLHGTCVETPLFPDVPFASVPQPGSSFCRFILFVSATQQLSVLSKQVEGDSRIMSKTVSPEKLVSHVDTIITQVSLCARERAAKKYGLKRFLFDIAQHNFYQDLQKDLSIITTIHSFAYNFSSK